MSSSSTQQQQQQQQQQLHHDQLREVIRNHFPKPDWAIGYGSGVFQQLGYAKAERPMVDLIFVVKDSSAWHDQNLRRNPTHYAFLPRLMGAKGITFVQERFPANIYYNTLVQVADLQVKYGVISTEDLMRDLQCWNTLYVSGRLHKPVAWLFEPEEQKERSRLQKAVQTNLRSALAASLLLFSPSAAVTASSSSSSSSSLSRKEIEDEELFNGIAGLSYSGDVRVGIGENPHKVKNIVAANPAAFRRLYSPSLLSLLQDDLLLLSPSSIPSKESYLFDPKDEEKRLRLFQSGLPFHIQNQILELAKQRGIVSTAGEDEKLKREVVRDGRDGRLLSEVICRTVRRSSSIQSLKGVYSAGLYKSLSYATLKILKRLKASK